MKKYATITLLTALLALALSSPLFAQGVHYATGDIDGDGDCLTTNDIRVFIRANNGDIAVPVNEEDADFNGDGVADTLDILIFLDYFQNGMSAFDPYGGYPVPHSTAIFFFDNFTTHCIGNAIADANCDGMGLSSADLVMLNRCLSGDATPICDLSNLDFNIDGIVDRLDAEIFSNYFVYGLAAFPYGYPARNFCYPILTLNADRCCYGFTGDVNADGAVDISDLTRLVDYMFGSGDPLACHSAANTDGSIECEVNISDLTRLVDHMFGSGGPTELCRPECE